MDPNDSSKLQLLQEHYEQRLRNLLALVHATSEDLRADDIVSAMKADPVTLPYAQQRTREVWDNVLEREREATITALMDELADAKTTIRELESRLMDSQRAVASVEEKFREERAKSDEITREAEKIHQKASASTFIFEESIRKRESEAYVQLSKARSDYDDLKADFDKLEADYERKSQELEATYQELAECTGGVHELQQEVEVLRAKLERQQELHQFHEKMSLEFQEADAATQERVTAMNIEISRLKNELRDSKSEVQRLEQKLKQQSDASQTQQDSLSRRFGENQAAIEQRYERELDTLREKVAAYRQQLQEAEVQLQESQRSVDNIRERWQQDISALKSEHEQTRSGLEKQREKAGRSYEQREAELRKQYEVQVEALHNHYKTLVTEKSKDFEGEINTEREQWKTRERTFREKIEQLEEDMHANYITMSEHDLLLREKDTSIEQAVKKLRAEIDESWMRKLKEDTEKARREVQTSAEQLVNKLRLCEEEKVALTLARRKSDEELQLAQQQIAKLQDTLAHTHSDFTALQKTHSATVQDLAKAGKQSEEAGKAISELQQAEGALQEELRQTQREVRQLNERLREQELAHKAKLIEQAAASREQLRVLEEEADQYRALTEQLKSELSSYKRANKQLEAEKDALLSESLHKDLKSQEVLKSVRAEEAEKSHSHIKVHNEVRGKLSTIEAALVETQAELEAQQGACKALQEEKTATEERLLRSSACIAEMEVSLKFTEKQLKEMKAKNETSVRALRTTVTQYSRIIRRLKSSFRSQLSQLQTDVLQELQNFSQSLSSLSSKCLLGLDNAMLTLQRRYQRDIVERQEQAESLQRRLEKAKTDSQLWVNCMESDHEAEIERLSSLNGQLATKLRTVEEEHNSMAFSLENIRQELLKKEEIRENQARECAQIQELLRRLQQENSMLRDKGKTETRVKLLESDYAKEMQRMAMENQRIRELSEQSIAQLKSEVESLQVAAVEERSHLMSNFKQKLSEKDAALAAVRSASNEEISRLRQDLLQMRRKTESSLESEVEGLVSNLRNQKQLNLKERDAEVQFRTDPHAYREVRASDSRFDTRLSLSQLTPNRK